MKNFMKVLFSLLLAWLLGDLTGCVTTPETGKTAFIITSENQEKSMGEEAFRQTLSKEALSTNARWNQILQRVGQRISKEARKSDYAWEFKLIESKQKNAFCLPGGKVAFYTGIFPIAKTEAGLAAIMGHEVAHAIARHAGQRMSMMLGTQLAMAGFEAILGGNDRDSKNLLLGALGLGFTVGAALPFSRANETEADRIGLVYSARAGYDPNEAPAVWSRMAQMGSSGPTILSTHPASEDRMRELSAQLPQVLPIYERSDKLGAGETL